MLLCWSCAGDKEGPSCHVGYRGFSFSSSSPHLDEEQGRGFAMPLKRLGWREGLCSQRFVMELDVSNSLHHHGCVSVVAHRYALCSPSQRLPCPCEQVLSLGMMQEQLQLLFSGACGVLWARPVSADHRAMVCAVCQCYLCWENVGETLQNTAEQLWSPRTSLGSSLALGGLCSPQD